MKTLAILIMSLLTMTVSINSNAVGDADAGKAKSAPCAACHGADGNSINTVWPKLAGQNATYLAKQLRDLKAGNRNNAMMSPMAAPLTDQDIDDLSLFFSTQKKQLGKANADLVELGEQIYRGGNRATGVPACSACHGPTGAGNPGAGYPSLNGQHADYTELQLNAFRSAERTNDSASIMRTIAKPLSDEEIKAVANYVQGLH